VQIRLSFNTLGVIKCTKSQLI